MTAPSLNGKHIQALLGVPERRYVTNVSKARELETIRRPDLIHVKNPNLAVGASPPQVWGAFGSIK